VHKQTQASELNSSIPNELKVKERQGKTGRETKGKEKDKKKEGTGREKKG
jgi:hypothetical protein